MLFFLVLFYRSNILLCFSEWRVSSEPPQGPDQLTVHRHRLRRGLPVPTGWFKNWPSDSGWPAHAEWPRHDPRRPRHRGRISPRPPLVLVLRHSPYLNRAVQRFCLSRTSNSTQSNPWLWVFQKPVKTKKSYLGNCMETFLKTASSFWLKVWDESIRWLSLYIHHSDRFSTPG